MNLYFVCMSFEEVTNLFFHFIKGKSNKEVQFGWTDTGHSDTMWTGY